MPKYVQCNGQKFGVVLEEFSITQRFCIKNAKIHLFKKIMEIEILLMVDFYAFSKVLHFFKIFRVFLISSVAHTKIVEMHNILSEHSRPKTVELD